jgi:hypothetical protein
MIFFKNLEKLLPLVVLMAWPTQATSPSPLSGATNINCSGNLVFFPKASKNVYLLTNGHCIPLLLNHSLHYKNPKLYILNHPMTGQIPIFNHSGQVENLHIKRVAFATMNENDLALVEMADSFDSIRSRGIQIWEVDRELPQERDEIEVISGYWKENYLCRIKSLNVCLQEGIYHWPRSLLIDDSCRFKSGVSGSPFVSNKSRKIVGLANTLADKGRPCELNMPCEVSTSGQTSIRQGGSYGQLVNVLYNCFDAGGDFSVESPNCPFGITGERLEIQNSRYL